jgi:hypothetical protein
MLGAHGAAGDGWVGEAHLSSVPPQLVSVHGI